MDLLASVIVFRYGFCCHRVTVERCVVRASEENSNSWGFQRQRGGVLHLLWKCFYNFMNVETRPIYWSADHPCVTMLEKRLSLTFQLLHPSQVMAHRLCVISFSVISTVFRAKLHLYCFKDLPKNNYSHKKKLHNKWLCCQFHFYFTF